LLFAYIVKITSPSLILSPASFAKINPANESLGAPEVLAIFVRLETFRPTIFLI